MPATIEEPAEASPDNFDDNRALLALYGDEFIDLWNDLDNLGTLSGPRD